MDKIEILKTADSTGDSIWAFFSARNSLLVGILCFAAGCGSAIFFQTATLILVGLLAIVLIFAFVAHYYQSKDSQPPTPTQQP